MESSMYKYLKEEFVSNLSGTSMLEIASLSFLFPAFLLLCKWQRLFFGSGLKRTNQIAREMHQRKGTRKIWVSCLWNLILDFTLVVIPILSILTILSGSVYFLTFALLCGVILTFLIGRKQSQSLFAVRNDKKEAHTSQLQFLSSYRFVIMLVTCLSILAVDFNIFPRRYAKTETYGTGLMDVGVGSFVVVNALVSKQARGLATSKKRGHLLQNSGPLLVLGFARLYLTKGVDYQVHVGEYGVHWNFFFTLAAVALLTDIIHVPARFSGILGASILVVYQLILLNGLNNYLNSSQREGNLISQNKEGIFSLFGYWGLYLLAVQLGYFIFKGQKFQKDESTLTKSSMAGLGATGIWTLAFFCWALTLLSDSFLERVSRRSCNLTYVLLILAVNLEGLGVLVLSELIPDTKQLMLEKIFTDNMLATFLLANVLTGLVNLSVNTIFTSAGVAYGILVLYSLVLVAGMGLMRILNLKVKF